MLTVTLGLLLHMGNALGQAVQARSDLLLALIALFLVLVHGAQQAFEMVFQNVLEIFQVRGGRGACLAGRRYGTGSCSAAGWSATTPSTSAWPPRR